MQPSGATIRPEHLRLGGYEDRSLRPTIGLALGGAAVRGTAHIGILKVLEREEIPVDYIAGTSVGSLVGALYASGFPIPEMEEIMPTLSWRQLVRPLWPRAALSDNTPLGDWIEGLCGVGTIDELQTTFACVATDALTGEAVVLRSGSLGAAVRASAAIPLLMQPVIHDGRTLWDGGLVHKVPAVLARSMGADIVIAVDVGDPSFQQKPPESLLDGLFHSIDIMAQTQVEEELEWADIVMQPRAPVSGYNFKNAPAFFEVGAEAAEEAIPLIRQRIAEAAEGR